MKLGSRYAEVSVEGTHSQNKKLSLDYDSFPVSFHTAKMGL